MSLTSDKKYRILQEVTDIYHSSIDRRQVIGKVIDCIEKEISPVDMFIYGDISFVIGLPMKNLLYTNILDERREILLAGNVSHCDDYTYFPLKGMIGTYGLIEVKKVLDDEDTIFVDTLIKLAASAIESIMIKDESDDTIRTFQHINRICFDLSEKNKVDEIKNYLIKNMKELLKLDKFVIRINKKGFLNLNKTDEKYGSRRSDDKYIKKWIKTIDKKDGSLIINDLEKELGEDLEFKSGIGGPFVKDDRIVGYCIGLSKHKDHFDIEDLRILNSISHYTSLILYNVILLENLQERVETDDLTKLFNRSYLENKIDNSLLYDERGAFLILDIDNFKLVNDTLGHKEGDNILIQVANIIKNNIRKHDIAARWGGEELVVYLPGMNYETSEYVANRLVNMIEKNTSPSVTVSCGVSYWEGKGIVYKDLFVVADKMLYASKNNGKNQYHIGEVLKGKE